MARDFRGVSSEVARLLEDPHDLSTYVRVEVPDLSELRADLEAIEVGLGREVTEVARRMGEPVATEAARLAPYDPEHRGHPHDDLPHIAESYGVRPIPRGAAVFTSHPGGPVWEFGGTIAPRGAEIHIPEWGAVRRAGDAKAEDAEHAALRAIDELLERHDL